MNEETRVYALITYSGERFERYQHLSGIYPDQPSAEEAGCNTATSDFIIQVYTLSKESACVEQIEYVYQSGHWNRLEKL